MSAMKTSSGTIPPVTRSQPGEPLKPRKEMVIAEAVRKGITSGSSSAILCCLLNTCTNSVLKYCPRSEDTGTVDRP